MLHGLLLFETKAAMKCAVSDLVIACGLFFFCHVRHVELYGASHVLRFGVFIISRTWFSWILTIIDYGLVIL